MTTSHSIGLPQMMAETGAAAPGVLQVTNSSSPAAKIALFRSLFRGRDDVYPRRFESRKTGRAGYAPACANEWVRGVCEKPKIKCADCPNRRFLPVTDEVIRWHLSGEDGQGRDFVMGVYPMLLDETCLFLAVDFDRENWQADSGAFVATCRRLDVPVALERSRSGNGGHVWFFFEEAIPASLARKLGSHILTETMERRPDLGLGSYDRLFPNQDTLPKGGFGNLIALPLQKRARDRGNSVFLDGEFSPLPDQWAFLSSVRRIGRARVEALVREAETKGRILGVRMAIAEEGDDAPWTLPPSRRRKDPPIAGPLPESIEMVLGDQIYTAKEDLPPALRNRLVRLAAFQNPEFYRAKARFFTGLSATVTRKDGHHPIIFMQCGPVRHRVDARQQAATRPFTHSVLVRPTGFRALAEPEQDARVEFQKLYDALHRDETRNRMICADVISAVRAGRSPLVLTERTEHLELLASRLAAEIPNVITLRGGMGRKVLKDALDRVARCSPQVGIANAAHGCPDDARVILATGRFIGEGFDDPRLDTLFLALPVSWRGTVAQYVGRLHRLHADKREVWVYDYADLNVPMLAKMFDRRCCGYESLGYTILLPASALPGWPVEVPLPIEPEWKRDYAASVRRLIRDGVDAPLANLFVHATRTPAPDAEGAARARSASEAFLYRRLETLAETAGQFRLNAELPIPFDNRGSMEVDLSCADARVAIELDGAQHLADAHAYRRDRRKDALLQQHGYLVLRFLAEDVGKQLDQVLDAIVAALVPRRNCKSH